MAIVYDTVGMAGTVCNKCGEWKPVSEFHRSKRHSDGYKSDCGKCRNTAARERIERPVEKTPTISPIIDGKVCVGCEEWKSIDNFSPLSWKGRPLGNGYRSRCKACSNAQARAKHAANPESYREKARKYIESRRDKSNQYQRLWRASNPDNVRRAQEIYRKANREKLRALYRKRRTANLEHHRAIGRKAYANNIEKRRAYNRAYRKTHPEISRAQVRDRRNHKYQADGSHTEGQWESLKMQYEYICLRCGRQEPEIILTRDHVIPLTQGGGDWITNIQPLCPTCNSSKNNKTIDYRTDWQPSRTPNAEAHEDP